MISSPEPVGARQAVPTPEPVGAQSTQYLTPSYLLWPRFGDVLACIEKGVNKIFKRGVFVEKTTPARTNEVTKLRSGIALGDKDDDDDIIPEGTH